MAKVSRLLIIVFVMIISQNSVLAQTTNDCNTISSKQIILNCMEVPVDLFVRINKSEFRPAGILIGSHRVSRIDAFDPNFPSLNQLEYDIMPSSGPLNEIEFIFKINIKSLQIKNKPIGAKVAMGKKHLIPGSFYIPHHFSTKINGDSLEIVIHFMDLKTSLEPLRKSVEDEIENKCTINCENLSPLTEQMLKLYQNDIDSLKKGIINEHITQTLFSLIVTDIHPNVQHP